ncbi:signal peptidase I [Lentisphaera araneosa]|jgi:signal peptidase I|nr:signal peptidase I [Lentisphaera araneosa]
MKTVIITILSVLFTSCSTHEMKMKSSSMEPTITKGSIVTLTKNYNEVNRFDIMVFNPYQFPENYFIFRVIGLPGEHIKLEGESVYINGKNLDIPNDLKYVELEAKFNNITLKENEFYLMGDNTTNSNDSRFLGPIRTNQFVSKLKKSKALTNESN